jgi:hypothetical protein
VAIRKVNAITGRDCAEAQQASRGRQLSASGIRASAATGGERDGMRQRNTLGAEYLRLRLDVWSRPLSADWPVLSPRGGFRGDEVCRLWSIASAVYE